LRYLFPRGGSVPTAKVQPPMFEFIKASRQDFNGVELDGKVIQLGKKTNAFVTHDAGLAEAINCRYGYARGASRDLIMNTIDSENPNRRVRFFVMPEMPWRRKKHDEEVP